MPKTRRNAAALLLGVAVGAALLSGCGSDITPRAVAEPASEKAPDAPKPTTPKRTPTPKADEPVFTAEVGDCVSLTGSDTAPVIALAPCGTPAAGFKVVATVAKHDECAADIDQWYASTRGGVETSALCMDVDWVVGQCYSTAGDVVGKIDCAAVTPGDVRLLRIISGSDDPAECGAGQGFAYTVRKTVVCAERL